MRGAINGERLRTELMARAVDQAHFAALAGVSPATISAAIRGKAINPATFKKIITALTRIPKLHGVDETQLLEVAS
jgi:transcriptional regulator with XRE-family HTH domain